MPELSVIICTYNRCEYLPPLFESLEGQTLSRNRFELIIIDNNSSDKTASMSREFLLKNPGLNGKYIFEEKPGLSHARNRGILESAGDILVFIDDDAQASPAYLENIVNYFDNHHDVQAGGGKILPLYESREPGWMTPFLLPVVSALDLGEKIRPFPGRKYPIGANMFFRKEVFDRIGLFNVDLGRKGKNFLGGE